MSEPIRIGNVLKSEVWLYDNECFSIFCCAFRRAIEKNGGIDRFSKITNVPAPKLLRYVELNEFPDFKSLKKIFPFMYDFVVEEFAYCIEMRNKQKLIDFYDELEMDKDENFGEKLKLLSQRYENYTNMDSEIFFDMFCEFIDVLFNDFKNKEGDYYG